MVWNFGHLLYFLLFFSAGDIVGLYNEVCSDDCITGVVTSISSKLLTVSLDDVAETLDQDATYFVAKLANDITFKRLKRFRSSYHHSTL